MFRRAARFILSLTLALPVACHPLPGASVRPTAPGLDGESTRQILIHRATAIHTLSSQCQVTLTQPDGQAILLDGVMILSVPDRLRLRAWKFNQPVFDLTLRPDGLWIQSPRQTGPGSPTTALVTAAQLSQFLSWLEGAFFQAPGLRTDFTRDMVVFRRHQENGTTLLCEVDRSTVTPSEFRLSDPAGKIHFRLSLSDYRDLSGIIWPLTITAAWINGPDDQGLTLSIHFSDLEFNGDLMPQAFTPPRDAEKQP